MKRLLVFVFFVALFGSCEKHTHGCIDPLATNYNAEATCDDGSCEYNYFFVKLKKFKITLP